MRVRRREVVAGVVLASAASVAAARRGVARTESDDPAARELLREIRDELRALRATAAVPPEIGQLRSVQHTFLRAAGKYPDVVEVGTRHFDAAHDWLRQSPHPIDLHQTADGRYALRFGFTMLVLRPDAQADFIGAPSETR